MFQIQLATLVLALAPLPGDAVELKWRFKTGDVFYARTVNSMHQTVTVNGNEQKQEQDQTTYHRYKVISAGVDGLVLEQTTLKSVVESNLPGAAGAADRARGVKLTYTIDKNQKVTKIEGYDNFLEKMSGGDAETKKILTTLLNKDTLSKSVEDLISVLPPKPVRPGDTWNRNSVLSMGPIGNFAVGAKYTLAGPVDGELQKIPFTATLKFSPPDGDGVLPFKVVGGSLKSKKFVGVILFDPKNGRVKETKVEILSAGKLTIAVNGQEIEMGLDQEIRVQSDISDVPHPEAAD